MTDLDRDILQAAAPLLDGRPKITAINPRVRRVTSPDRAVIVKTFPPDNTAAFHRELAGAETARAAIGTWVPAVLGVGTLDSGHHYVICTEVPGTDLATATRTADVDRPHALRLVGDILRRVHQSTRAGYGPVDEPPLTTAHELLATHATHRASLLAAHNEPDLAHTISHIADRLSSTLANAGAAVLCHGDLHLHNVIGIPADGGFEVHGVVDYETVIFAFPEYDLAKTIVVSSAFSPADRQALTTGYKQPVNDHALVDLTTYHALDGWLWAVLIEGRDRHLWSTRLHATLNPRLVLSRTAGLVLSRRAGGP